MKLTSALLLLCLALPAQASPRRPWRDKRWLAGLGIIGLSVAADALSSCQRIGQRGVETSPVFNGNRSCATTAGIAVGAFAFYTALHATEWKVGHDDPTRIFRDATL